jgi:hypothetical protein
MNPDLTSFNGFWSSSSLENYLFDYHFWDDEDDTHKNSTTKAREVLLPLE